MVMISMNKINKIKNRRERREKHNKKRTFFAKLRLIALVFFVFIFMLMFRVLYLQAHYGKEYELRVIKQQISKGYFEKTLKPNRGSILDRNKYTLASSETVYTVFIDVYAIALLISDEIEIEKRNATKKEPLIDVKAIIESFKTNKKEDEQGQKIKASEYLIGIIENDFGMPKQQILDIINDPKNKDNKHYIIKREVSKEFKDKFDEYKKKPLHIYFEEDFIRKYSNNNLASNLIGFIRTDNSWGLENKYDEYLKGTEGRILRRQTNDIELANDITQSDPGKTLVTTIDTNIQKIAEDELINIGQKYDPLNASVIIMNPFTGEILGYAQYPNFDPNNPSDITLSNNKSIQYYFDSLPEIKRSETLQTMWNDNNIFNTFEPGSTYKPLVAAAALEEGIITENDTFFCSGARIIGQESVPCNNPAGHGQQTLEQALANSCNVALMDIILKLGALEYYNYQRDFGFGEYTGIDLPKEQSGANLLHTLSQLDEIPMYLATNGMGQGFNCTPLQSINAFAATINGGNLMKPYVVSKVLNKDGSIVLENKPTIIRKVISKHTSDQIKRMLVSTVSPYGTGKKAIIDGYNVGGKTGTAQQGIRSLNKLAYSFIAYLTEESPELLISVIINQPKIETEETPNASESIRNIMIQLIKYKGIKPSNESLVTDNFIYDNNVVELPDLTGKSILEAEKTILNLGLDFELSGVEGDYIKSQIPLAGAKLTTNTKVFLTIAKSADNKELILIPDVIGQELSNAKQELVNQGFIVISDLINTELEEDTKIIIKDQNPKAGQKIQKGAIIKLY